jgi:arsenate reductase (glutaredoxin)
VRRAARPSPDGVDVPLADNMLYQPRNTTEREAEPKTGLIRIYYDAGCPHSRAALAYLEERGFEPDIADLTQFSFTVEHVQSLVRLLGIAPSSLMRRSVFNRLQLKTTGDYDELVQLLVEHPELLDRPIVIFNGKARICRPLEKLYDLVD